MNSEVHVVEPLGDGGIFQHAIELAKSAAAKFDVVVVHTARDHEELPAPGVTICPCIRWFRPVWPRWVRTSIFTIHFSWTNLIHIRSRCRGHALHVQGAFHSPLYGLSIWAAKGARRAIFSPHNVFSRDGRVWKEELLRRLARKVDLVVVYSEADADVVRSWGCEVKVLPLVQWIPSVAPSRVSDLRAAVSKSGSPIVLVAGQIRADKGIPDAIDAMALMGTKAQLVVMGDDRGDLERCRVHAIGAGVTVHWEVGYQPMERFVAALLAADVIVIPARQASQSGVLAIAHQLGIATVAYPAGGLAEKATIAAASMTPVALAAGIGELLDRSASEAPNAVRPASIDVLDLYDPEPRSVATEENSC